ncbi:MAG: S41 family peptidase [Planctomycetota bacterium]|jgi:C-terminal peptidase prc|nr:S41 family peptidase [Planctomycetota bacterium]
MFQSAVLALLTALPTSAALARPGDLEVLLNERLEAASALAPAELWPAIEALGAVVPLEKGQQFDALVDSALDREGLAPAARLFLVGLRLAGDDVDLAPLAEHLVELAQLTSGQSAVVAADLLGGEAFRPLDQDSRRSAATALLAVAEDGNREPATRVACARALHQHGTGAQFSAARRILLGFLESSSGDLRAQGAIALAEVGDMDSARGELEGMASGPGAAGRLAAALLKQEDIRRLYVTKLRDKEAWYHQRLESENLTGTGTEARRLETVMQLIERTHLEGDTVDREELLSAALGGMLHHMDRHSSYMSPTVYKKFEQDIEAEYGGIGAYVGEDPDNGMFTIRRPIYSGPAYLAGLRSDDKIVRIGDWPTLGEPLDDIIKRLKGKPGTSVRVYVWRTGMAASLIERPSEEMAVEIERAQITTPPVYSSLLPGGVGLVELTTFSRVASQELVTTISDLAERGMTSMILDLRNNSGGLLTEARAVGDLFLPQDLRVVSTESRVEETRHLKTRGPALLPPSFPLVVLTNRYSASASEIVSGALQDHGRATLIGQRTYGKGSVQTLITMPGEKDDRFEDQNQNRRFDDWEPLVRDWDEDGEFDFAPRVKLTIARYLLPSGRSIHRELDEDGTILSDGGVEPDLEVNPRRWKQWKAEEVLRLDGENHVRDWVDEHVDANRDLFEKLAEGDGDDANLYPGFDSFYAGLNTVLPREDVRFLLRREVRRRVQDLRGAAFPQGSDFQEDYQLQAAIDTLLSSAGDSWRDIPEYASTFDIDLFMGEEEVAAVQLPETQSGQVNEGLALIDEATRTGGTLSETTLERLREILNSLAN